MTLGHQLCIFTYGKKLENIPLGFGSPVGFLFVLPFLGLLGSVDLLTNKKEFGENKEVK